ncbi:MAG: flagellin, partial [Alphaproteobacteria bacterium]
QNRLEFAAANIATATENTEAARSQLLDLDVASEMSSFVSKQLLIQAGVAMLAQANQLPQGLLSLFR